METKIPLIIIEDQKLFRQTLAAFFKGIDQFLLAGEFGDFNSFLKSAPLLTKEADYIALLDLDIIEGDAEEVNKIIHNNYKNIKVIAFSQNTTPHIMQELFANNVRAFLQKNCDKEELVTAIKVVHQAGYYLDATTISVLNNRDSQTQSKKGKNNYQFIKIDRAGMRSSGADLQRVQ